MIDVLLINPPETFGFYWEVFYYYPPLGLCYLAAACEKKGLCVKIIDAKAENIGTREVIKRIAQQKPKIIGIYVSSVGLTTLPSLIQGIKKVLPSACIVVGGPHISAYPKTIRLLDVPYGFMGEAEIGFSEFCSALLKKTSNIHLAEGLIWFDKDNLHCNESRNVDLDTLTFPARHLLSGKRYFHPMKNGFATSLITSRGCPFRCAYCSKSGTKANIVYRSVENIIEEIKQILRFSFIKHIIFLDDIFTLDPDRVQAIAQSIIKEKLVFSWSCQTRADCIDQPLIDTMKASGLTSVAFGVETGSERLRYALGKEIDNETYKKAVRLCKDAGLDCVGFFMYGLPGETKRDVEETVSFAKGLGLDSFLFDRLILLPDSLLFQKAVREKKVAPDAWNLSLTEHGTPSTPVYLSNSFIEKEALAMLFKVYSEINLSPRTFWKKIQPIFASPSKLFFYMQRLFFTILYILSYRILKKVKECTGLKFREY